MAERMIEANGVELCAESFGDSVDSPILLVMGLGASMLWWEEGFCRMLADGARRPGRRARERLQGRTTAIFAVTVAFNEFLVALVLTSTPDAETVPRGVSTLVARIDTDWAAMSAGGVLAALPIVVFALLVQRHLVRGLTMGAVR